ncbi:MAG: tRNA pseudouridine(55) synthase TruB [Bacteroidetes bacterium]|nr:tRNA pseudouridine(55) synthase TruB [Bacteroidota bacterium]
MTFDFVNGEVLLINKPLEWTSFDVVKKIRNTISRRTGLRKIKVGHAGTLDPLATGLLIVCTGKFTKKINEFQDQDKEYIGTFIMGASTPSFDRETEVNGTFETKHLDAEMLQRATQQFVGEIDQVPPLYSAVMVNGVRAYHHARNKEEVTLKSRRIKINRFDLTRIELPEIDFVVNCSKGTYIRSLARDFGGVVQSGAYLKSLTRTRIGDFTLNQAMSLETFEKMLNIASEEV